MTIVPETAHGAAELATEEELKKETTPYYLASDDGLILLIDSGEALQPDTDGLGYTNPNLHRRIDVDAFVPQGSSYPFVHYDSEGRPFDQSIVVGVWDGVHSYRTTTTYTHDEESTTCEIP